jgi:alpha/beta superfamily hydrolase
MPTRQPIRFHSAGLALEGELTWPDGPALLGAVICHPHPLYGGDMRNNATLAIERALLRHGVAGLRFNFRGVGRSEGAHAGGEGEREDARAALAYLRAQPGLVGLPSGLGGFSFGGVVALAAAADEPDLAFLVLVSPAARQPPSGVERIAAPKLIVGGGRDSAIPPDLLAGLAAQLHPPKKLVIVDTADHFWFAREKLLEDAIEGFLVESGL